MSSSPWLALFPKKGDPFEGLHLTLGYFPNVSEIDFIHGRISSYVGAVGLLKFSDCLVNGKAFFHTLKGTALVHLVSDERLSRIRQQLINDFLREATCEYRHAWVPHMTYRYSEAKELLTPAPGPMRVTFDTMTLLTGKEDRVVEKWLLK